MKRRRLETISSTLQSRCQLQAGRGPSALVMLLTADIKSGHCAKSFQEVCSTPQSRHRSLPLPSVCFCICRSGAIDQLQSCTCYLHSYALRPSRSVGAVNVLGGRPIFAIGIILWPSSPQAHVEDAHRVRWRFTLPSSAISEKVQPPRSATQGPSRSAR